MSTTKDSLWKELTLLILNVYFCSDRESYVVLIPLEYTYE